MLDAADLLASAPPRIDPEEAEAVAREHWGIGGRATPLTSERDANFRIVCDDGAYVLKVANPAEPAAVTDLQTAALLHIAERDPALAVPRVLRTRDGRTHLDRPGAGLVRLLTFLPGEPLSAVPADPRQGPAVARLLAALGAALEGFRHPAAGRALLWDIAHAAALRPLLDTVEDAALRRLAAAALDRFDAEVAPALPRLRRQVVHNDFNPHNLLVDPADPGRIAGVIDFGDVVETALACDLAVAASYRLGPDEDPEAALPPFVAAYHAVRPLLRADVAVLPALVSARMAATVAITAWRAARYPENRAYILRNVPRARAGLERLAAADPAALAGRLLAACALEDRG